MGFEAACRLDHILSNTKSIIKLRKVQMKKILTVKHEHGLVSLRAVSVETEKSQQTRKCVCDVLPGIRPD